MKREMLEAAENLEFEKAAYLRDLIKAEQAKKHKLFRKPLEKSRNS